MYHPIRFVVIGLGHIGKRHCQVIRNNPMAKLVAIVDIDESLRNDLEELFEVPFFSSLEQFLESKIATDVINICTPNGYHAEHSIKGLKSGFHVVCEKPMAISTEQAQEMLKVSSEEHKTIFCVMQNRYSPSAIWLKTLLKEKKLGEINTVVVNCFWNRDERYYNSSSWRGTQELDGGVLFTQFSHFIDTLYWLFGDITNISTRSSNFSHSKTTAFDDSGISVFDFVNGGQCSFNFSISCWDKNFLSSIQIVGSKGCVSVGGQYMNEIQYCHIEDYEMPLIAPSLPPNDYGFYKGSAANHDYVIQNVIDHLIKKTPITSTAEEGFKVVEIIERIYNATNINS